MYLIIPINPQRRQKKKHEMISVFFVISISQHLKEINSHVVQIKDELYTIHQCPFIVSRLKVMSYVPPRYSCQFY